MTRVKLQPAGNCLCCQRKLSQTHHTKSLLSYSKVYTLLFFAYNQAIIQNICTLVYIMLCCIMLAVLSMFVIIVTYIISLTGSVISIFGGSVGGRDLTKLYYSKDYQHLLNKIAFSDPLPPTITLDSVQHRLKYRRGESIVKPIYHIGQRKLFDNELQFLTNQLAATDNAIVVYAGSSPSNHIYYLHTLFPNVKFLLVDPSEAIIYTGIGTTHYKTPSDKIVYLRHSSGETSAQRSNNTLPVNYLQCDKIVNILKEDATPNDIKSALKCLKNSDHRIFIFEDYYSVELSEEIKDIFSDSSNDSSDTGSNASSKRDTSNKIFFWSDIRTTAIESAPTDIDIIWNLAQQYNWVTALQPTAFMLKFRMPFGDIDYEKYKIIAAESPYADDIAACGLDFTQFYTHGVLPYFDGKVYIQPFMGRGSTESRLVCCRIDTGSSVIATGDTGSSDATNHSQYPIKLYDVSEYDDKFYYYNNIERSLCLHTNNYANASIGFDLCGDCALEAHILEQYKQKINPKFDIAAAIRYLTCLTKRSLHNENHGKLFHKHNPKQYISMVRREQSV